MAELGNKFVCYNCSTKFYDLGKAEPLCPKCGANQKDAEKNDQAALSQAARRKRKTEVVKPLDIEEDEPIDEIPGEDLATDDEITLTDDELEADDFDDEE